MSAARPSTKEKSPWIVATALVLLLLSPGLYVLSYGPYAQRYPTNYDPPWAAKLYYPLHWCADHSELVAEWLQWYVNLWIH